MVHLLLAPPPNAAVAFSHVGSPLLFSGVPFFATNRPKSFEDEATNIFLHHFHVSLGVDAMYFVGFIVMVAPLPFSSSARIPCKPDALEALRTTGEEFVFPARLSLIIAPVAKI